MRPLAYFPTGIFQHIFWAGLKHFHCDFWSGFTMIYGEKYSFLSLFTKALRTDGPMDQRTNGRTDGRTDGPTDTPSYRDAWTHLKSVVNLFPGQRESIERQKRYAHRCWGAESTFPFWFSWPAIVSFVSFLPSLLKSLVVMRRCPPYSNSTF